MTKHRLSINIIASSNNYRRSRRIYLRTIRRSHRINASFIKEINSTIIEEIHINPEDITEEVILKLINGECI